MTSRIPDFPKALGRLAMLGGLLFATSHSWAQDSSAQNSGGLDSTVVYPADYFAQYSPVSVNDMIDRVPGISVALNAGTPSGGGANNNNANNNNRGLGAGAQILINGKRLAGKDNEARNQLSRIAANQVRHIEIIRGTSGDLDVRSAGQIVNIVLMETLSSSTLSVEAGAIAYHDGHTEPQGAVVYSGQRGGLNYLFSAERRSAYEALESWEDSFNADFSPNDYIRVDQVRDQSNLTLNTNLTYDLTLNDRIAFNALVGETDPPVYLDRSITNLNLRPPVTTWERETIPSKRENWEVGGDYEHQFASGSRYRLLLIANEETHDTVRERYAGATQATTSRKNLFLASDTRTVERIARTSYNFQLGQTQGVELGIERALTRLESSLRMGVPGNGTPSPAHGGLVPAPLPNANSTVQEIRYEPFVVHNWQINPRMSLESSLEVEISEIEQTGDTRNKRDFSYPKPKLDYRFDLNASTQLRLSVERFISQLSFADFTASTANNRDEQQAVLAGNPELEQEKAWRYTVNMEYRLPQDGGVFNANLFFYDVEDAIGKIDVSPPGGILSANGNTGDGEIYGINLDASIRYSFFGLSPALITAGLLVQESTTIDPMGGFERRIVPYDRGNYRFGFRQDFPAQALSVGMNYREGIEGNRRIVDIDKIDVAGFPKTLNLFVEKRAFAGFVFRLDANNAIDGERCRSRERFAGSLTKNAPVAEYEYNCNITGPQYVFTVRKTFQ
ncbi:MAG: TonB-dependent receptor [Gammaproteobacteria bacterium]|nr:TonB-dependent receptor [Gammaproteobacteria bacterium]MDP2347645.1 TonB-dependent receptor [Gammaproteobacteria bacterium]